jgi:hypothetical protein
MMVRAYGPHHHFFGDSFDFRELLVIFVIGAVMPAILEVQNLSKKYGEFTAVKGILFEIQEGEIFSLLGPNPFLRCC